MAGKRQKLHSYVYRVLTLRLALATLLLCIVLATVIFITQRNQIGELVVETALNRVNLLREQTLMLLEQPDTEPVDAFHTALHSMQSAELQQQLGQFVYARFYTPDGRQFTESSGAETDILTQEYRQLVGTPLNYPGLHPWHQVVRIDGRPHVHLVAPIKGRTEAVAAYAEGLFAISDMELGRLRATLLRSIGWVVLIVLVTAAILYPVIIKLTRRLVGYSQEIMESHLETIQILGSAIAKRDSDTSAHNFRVTIMAIRVAEALGLSTPDIKRLIIGAFLHDVGKIGIRDEILLKPGRLDEKEFEVMKTHVDHGVDIISRTEWLRNELPEHVEAGTELLANSDWLGSANRVVSHHHEKYDGSGYPRGSRGEAIPLESRIFSVVDVFDALTCKRPYKQPFSFEKSMEILEEGRGTHFDPQVLDTFLNLADELYKQVAGREDKYLQTELEAAASHYFYAGLEALDY